ncbi:MAG: prepilin-type N-terminal cleavage/methylation domain-containing protein [Gemmatimonadetes bacterium]|nr:prepilin-type N-terminal cleavage/methylation domain-containing protein [Gemmatimonadota bacterium]NIO31973.1 prepilin-type N-terminal cleavage/methylation domain-containing protein [Gemmatimonadota bacterium]
MRNKSGFTLVELLTVILIIGLLAVIALPRFVNTRDKAFYSAMRSDLRNLATAEENYFAETLSYTNDKNRLDSYRTSKRIIVSIPEATDKGWRAMATHEMNTDLECEIYYGTATGQTIATNGGAVYCNN